MNSLRCLSFFLHCFQTEVGQTVNQVFVFRADFRRLVCNGRDKGKRHRKTGLLKEIDENLVLSKGFLYGRGWLDSKFLVFITVKSFIFVASLFPFL